MNQKLNQSGLTIVELLTVIVVTTIMIGTVMLFFFNIWRGGASMQQSQEALSNRANAGDYLRNAIDSSSGLITQNDLPDSHVEIPDPADATGTFWLKIHAIPKTVTAASGSKAAVIYLTRPSRDASKNFILNGAQPYQDDLIIYLDGTTKQLMARTIANPYAPGNAAKTTCPAASASSSCPADAVIATDISSIDTRYFSRSGNTIDWTSVVEKDVNGVPVVPTTYIGPDFPAVEVVEFKLRISKKVRVSDTKNTSSETIIRVALRN